MKLSINLKYQGTLPKQEHSVAECQDAIGHFVADGRFAVSDGATEAVYSNIWAKILVDSFSDLKIFDVDIAQDFEIWLEVCRQKWDAWEATLATKRLPYFTRNKLIKGSYATFLGLVFDINSNDKPQLRWQGIAYGDTCAFFVKEERLIYSFPLTKAEEFDDSPPLLCTKPQANSLADNLFPYPGNIDVGCRVYIMTDALAQWFLTLYAEDKNPWTILDGITNDDDLALIIQDYRQSGKLKNDDVALVILACEEVDRDYE